MAQDIVNENQKISYTNLDFSAIYTETLDLIKQLTYRWDPSISDESDPGVILVKLSALLADKCNYNIDKNVLETFPLSVTQNGNARQLYDQLGYYMDWYESAVVPVSLSWIGDTTDPSISYTIPKFTHVSDIPAVGGDIQHIYSLIGAEDENGIAVSNTILPADGKTITVMAMEGTAVQYQFENEKVITAQMVDPLSRRLYFPHSLIAQNGIFIKNTNQENYASWKRVNNLYENSYNELRYIFGYDSNTNTCFLEFPDNYAELFGSGIEIEYLVVPQETSNIKPQVLAQFLAPISVGDDNNGIVLDSSNVKITNFSESYGHKNIESLNDAYINYKRTVGTFKTLITLRDYLNFIRNKELDICSNAFVCDRTNDIQSVYKIMSKSHDLDTLIIKVEQIVDKTNIESTFDYKFIKTSDATIDPSKTYYTIHNDTLTEVTPQTGEIPRDLGWYEMEGIETKTHDALTPFSLKFYLLRKAIALNSKTAYNQTFDILRPYPNFDYLLGDTAHLEHTYEDLLPLGENSYKKSNDDTWLENKSYWLYDEETDIYSLITDISGFDQSPADSPVYEIDVEALLPHTIMFKAVYPILMNVSTFNVLDETTQANISSNIISSLYANVSSSEVDFGLPISIDYLVDIAKNSDDRIKSVSIDPISYSLFATYYDKEEDSYIDLEIDSNMDNYMPGSQRDISDIVSSLIKKDIVCKSILAGTTQLLVPDKTFIYHLSQKYISYVNNIGHITGEANIDIRNNSVTSYSIDSEKSFIRKTYTLKDNEIISLYRPHFYEPKTFNNNIHFEYVLFNNISANSSYKLRSGEYFIFYKPITDDNSTSIIGYSVYACGSGAIIKPTFDVEVQPDTSALSNFARSKIVPYFIVNPTKEFYETSTYNENYKTEIRNSSAIINNAIEGTNEVALQEVSTITIDRNDKYKFFWILNNPTYSNDSNLKSYTLFDDFDSVEQNEYSEIINTYTLREGEYLYYTNESNTDFDILAAGTTLIRNCGVESSIYTKIDNSLYFVDIQDISHVLSDALFLFDTDDNDKIRPFISGLFEIPNTQISPEDLDDTANPYALGLYERISYVDEDTEEETSVSFVITKDTSKIPGTNYYKPDFVRTKDVSIHTDKHYYVLVMRKQPGSYIKTTVKDIDSGLEREVYVSDEVDTGCFKEVDLYSNLNPISDTFDGTLVSPKDKNLYEIVTSSNQEKVIDIYKLNDNYSATSQNRFTLTEDTSIISRNILSDTLYSGLVLTDPSTYTTLKITDLVSANPENLGLLKPKYKDYYSESSGTYTKVDVSYLSNPSSYILDPESNPVVLYTRTGSGTQEDPYVYTETTDTTPEVIKVEKSTDAELFTEQNSLFTSSKNDIFGLYYKPSSINFNYYYKNLDVPYLDAGIVLSEYEEAYSFSPLDFLYQRYIKHQNDEDQLKAIYYDWIYTVTYQPPYYPVEGYNDSTTYSYDSIVSYNDNSYRCIVPTTSGEFNDDDWVKVDTTWKVKGFTKNSDYTGLIDISNPDYTKYIKVHSDAILEKSIALRNIYPALEGDASATDSYFYISSAYLDYFFYSGAAIEEISTEISIPTGTNPKNRGWYERVEESGSYTYVHTDDETVQEGKTYYSSYYYTISENSFIDIDTDQKLNLLFPNARNNIEEYGTVHVYFLPKFYKFNDFVKPTNKQYFESKELYNRNCGEIKAWTCTAIDSDSILEDPIKNIGTLWTSLQTNTSLTVLKNDIQSFASGDTLFFEATEESEAYVNWPIFNNQETILDLTNYKISYQRVGGEIEELSTIDVDNYKWRGYSSLILNTSNSSGQALDFNHTLSLYEGEASTEPITTLYGPDVVFQLKYPVENRSGTFIDVSTVDILGESIMNELYAFTPFSNGTYYSYNTNDYSTYLNFNSNDPEEGEAYEPQSILLPVGLPVGHYLLGMNMKDDILLTVDYINLLEGTFYNIEANAVSSTPLEDTENDSYLAYTFDTTYHNYLKSYFDSERTAFTKDKYDYIMLDIESEYKKITLPSLITLLENKSPQELNLYEIDENGSYVLSTSTNKGSSLLEIVSEEEEGKPKSMGWYEEDSDIFILTSDTSKVSGKTYYKEPNLYVNISDVSSSLNFQIWETLGSPYTSSPVIYSILDIFKYENNPDLGSGFNYIREKIKRLDKDEEYNYMFVPKSNDLIENPLDPKMFWNSNHVYNEFIIPQLNFDELNFRYTTTKMNK